MIDDGPFARLCIHRTVKRFDRDISRWPRPPQRGGEDWGTYWTYRVEETIFMVGLITRKLIEADKLLIETQAHVLTVSFAPLVGNRVPDKINYPQLERFYGVSAAYDVNVSVVGLCNALVHSFVLVPQFSYSGPDGLRLDRFFLASDRGKKKGVYVIDWRWFVRDFTHLICTNDVCEMRMLRLPSGETLVLPGRSTAMGLDNLTTAYCALSDKHRERYERFLTDWEASYGVPSGWPRASHSTP